MIGVIMSDTKAVAGEKGPQDGIMAGYLVVRPEKVPDEYNAGYSMYVTAFPLVKDYPGNRFQTGLFGTWMFAQNEKTLEGKKMYSDIEGGLGWWRDTRFATTTPKFIMGGVALNFVAWANGPGAGKGRSWSEPKGKYAVAQLSPHIVWPPDGLNLKQGASGELFGYGYMPLPLTDAKDKTAGKDIPTGGNCWTLFLNTSNFKGPVACFLPFFFSRPSLDDPEMAGMFLDSRPSNPNRSMAMETQYIPAAVAAGKDGTLFGRIASTTFPCTPEGKTVCMHRVVSYRQDALVDDVKSWFGGADKTSGQVRTNGEWRIKFPGQGNPTWKLYDAGKPKEERYLIDWDTILSIDVSDPYTFCYRWNEQHIDMKKSVAAGFVTLPEYYRLVEPENGEKKWVVVRETDVPAETGLKELEFPAKQETLPPYRTPEADDSCWKKPGPVAGPFEARLGDGSVVVYYWYRFADQPSLLNADLTEEEREAMQKKVEKIHRAWHKDGEYLAPPEIGTLAAIDPALVVTPPKGFEVGYVPIATWQGRAVDRGRKTEDIDQ